MEYTWQFEPVWQSLDLLIGGLAVTAQLTLYSVLFGILVAILVAGARTSRSRILRGVSRVYIELFRGLPLLVLLVWLYYCLPLVTESALHLSPFWIGVLGLALNFSALEAEILRSGYEAIPRGEIDVARTFNFSPLQTARYIIIPQALWRSLPPTLGQVINTVKFSALVSFISVPELFYVNQALVQDTFRPLEFYSVLAVLYLLLIIPASVCVQILEAQLNRRFRGG
ncbi:MAG TPA: amino acid ABC transporter permease [Longimicrobium sp.]